MKDKFLLGMLAISAYGFVLLNLHIFDINYMNGDEAGFIILPMIFGWGAYAAMKVSKSGVM